MPAQHRLRLILIGIAVTVGACEEELFRCPEPRISLRNPTSFVCVEFHVPSMTCPDESEPPTWAACNSCADVGTQAECLVTPGCRAAYDNCYLFDEPCLGGRVYIACVGVDRAGPVAGACEDLDAQDCSSRDDCASWYQQNSTCGEQPEEPRPYRQPQNGTCVLAFWGCRVEPTSPIADPAPPT